MGYVIMYKDPDSGVAYNLLQVEECPEPKLIIPKILLLKLSDLWKLKKEGQMEYRVQKNMYTYLLTGLSHLNFFEKDSDIDNLWNYIDHYLMNCTEDKMKDLYDQMFIPKDGYAPFISIELR